MKMNKNNKQPATVALTHWVKEGSILILIQVARALAK